MVRVSRCGEGIGSNFDDVIFSKNVHGTDHSKKANFQTHSIFQLVFQDQSANLSYSHLARLFEDWSFDMRELL